MGATPSRIRKRSSSRKKNKSKDEFIENISSDIVPRESSVQVWIHGLYNYRTTQKEELYVKTLLWRSDSRDIHPRTCHNPTEYLAQQSALMQHWTKTELGDSALFVPNAQATEVTWEEPFTFELQSFPGTNFLLHFQLRRKINDQTVGESYWGNRGESRESQSRVNVYGIQGESLGSISFSLTCSYNSATQNPVARALQFSRPNTHHSPVHNPIPPPTKSTSTQPAPPFSPLSPTPPSITTPGTDITSRTNAEEPTFSFAVPGMALLPHIHTVLCERTKSVCTTSGTAKEGNVLTIHLPELGIVAPNEWLTLAQAVQQQHSAPNVTCTWYASHPEQEDPDPETPNTNLPTFTPGTLPPAPPGTAPPSFRIEGHPHPFHRIAHPPLDEASSLPPGFLHAIPPHPTPVAECIEEVSRFGPTSSVDGSASPFSAPDGTSPLTSPVHAATLLRDLTNLALKHPFSLPITRNHVGKTICALVHTPDTTFLVGPSLSIRPSAPKIWELALAGMDATHPVPTRQYVPRVGGTLVAETYYYGGEPGACQYTWIRVDQEGRREEFDRGAVSPLHPLPEYGSPSVSTDPRCYVLTEDDLHAEFKVSCTPVRSDGQQGSITTSRPSKEVQPKE